MKMIIAGSRKLKVTGIEISEIMAEFRTPSVVICGEAKGPDTAGKHWAVSRNITVWSFPAPWNAWGKAAGIQRNRDMAKIADLAIIFWDGESRGTLHMISEMQKLSKPVEIINI